MHRSIRWTLLAWNAVLLSSVLAGFGSAAFLKMRRSRIDEIDSDLLRIAQLLSASLDRPERGMLEIPYEFQPRLRKGRMEDRNDRYFAVWNSEGSLIHASRKELDPSRPDPRRKPERRPHPWRHRDRDGYREVILQGMDGSTVLVGRSLQDEMSKLRGFLWWFVASGVGVLALGIAGSWWVSRSVLAPIEEMTATAESISASNLSRRIDARSTRSELGKLAGVLNAMFARLEDAFGRQTRFAADASHELRTPLSVIQTQTDLALARDRSVEEYRHALEACRKACGRMRSVVDDLMVLARADAGRLLEERLPIDLASLVRDCLAFSSKILEERGVRWKADIEPVEVSGDPKQISRAIQNIIDNAVVHNSPGGTVEVSLARDGPDAVVVIADTGPGISQEDAPHVCDRFYRGDASRSRNVGGSGLGLSIVKEIIEAHGGRILLSSEEGRGTTVTLRIPRDSLDAVESARTIPSGPLR